ncbi:hypothetical protein D3C80_1071010 [compost metagenome]
MQLVQAVAQGFAGIVEAIHLVVGLGHAHRTGARADRAAPVTALGQQQNIDEMAGRFEHIAGEQDAVCGGANGQQRKLVAAGPQRSVLRAVDVCPRLMLLTEMDQAADVQAGAHLFIERMIGARLGQALQ